MCRVLDEHQVKAVQFRLNQNPHTIPFFGIEDQGGIAFVNRNLQKPAAPDKRQRGFWLDAAISLG